ncbi:MAG: ATP-binding protein [Muribaculaceae bacterium]|nr:ATP-binding protein [Muribaculaceae bacterium]
MIKFVRKILEKMYIPRLLSRYVLDAQPFFSVTVITGPRRSGKTQLCKHLFPDYKYVNLEDLDARVLARDHPKSFLDSLGKNAIIDEAQNVPEIMSSIQVAVDQDKDIRYIITGSANFALIKGVTQSLAGRVAMFTLLPLSFPELIERDLYSLSIEYLMWRGSYPGVVAENIPVDLFYRNYVNTYIERDVRDLLNVKDLLKFQIFLKMTAARCGSEFNAVAISKEVGVSATTVTEWLSVLMASYIVYRVAPYHINLNKRLTKMPKLYFYDTGLLAYLLGLENENQIEKSPYRGILFENLAMGELLKQRYNQGKEPDMNFYREHSGKEVDVVAKSKSGGLHLYEIKASKAFHAEFTKNIKYLEGLVPEIDSWSVIYDGDNVGDTLINIREI